MSSILVINAAGRETRVALVENGDIAEFYLERKKDKGIVGNIYKGRVVRVLPGMQAAFLDIGLDKAAFLYVSDVVYDPDFARAAFELTEGEHDEDVPEVPEAAELQANGNGPPTDGSVSAAPHEEDDGPEDTAPEATGDSPGKPPPRMPSTTSTPRTPSTTSTPRTPSTTPKPRTPSTTTPRTPQPRRRTARRPRWPWTAQRRPRATTAWPTRLSCPPRSRRRPARLP